MSNVSVPVISDNVVEGREEFDLTLYVPSSLGPAITASNENITVVEISDSTSK